MTTTTMTTTQRWLIDAVERSKGRSAPIFEEARRRGISQREFHCALDAAGLDFAEFGEKIIRRARPAAKPVASASKAPPTRPAKPSAAQQARAVESVAAVAAVLREKRRAEEAAAAAAAKPAAVKPAPAAQFNPRELWAKYSTSPGDVFGGRRRQSR